MINKIKYLAVAGILGLNLVGAGCRDDQMYTSSAQSILEAQKIYEQSRREKLQEDYNDFSQQRRLLIEENRTLKTKTLEANELLESTWESEGIFRED